MPKTNQTSSHESGGDADRLSYHTNVPGDWTTPNDRPRTIQHGLDHLSSKATSHFGFFNGSFLEAFDAKVTSNGSTITMTLEKIGGGDLTLVFSDGHTTFDATPAATIALTVGTDTAPQANYIYILKSDKILTVSTSDWPSAEHNKIAYFLVPSASLVQSGASGNNLAYVNQNWNDFAKGSDSQGHMVHMSERSRRLGAIWTSGMQGVATQDGTDLWVSVSAGIVYQLHRHTVAALDSDTAGAGDTILVINDPDAAYAMINSLNSITKHSDGSSVGQNKYLKFVLWLVANKTGEVSPMIINLPSGEYNSAASAALDVDGKANFTIPAEFSTESSTGVLAAAFVCKHSSGSGMEIQSTEDLRGRTPFNVAGAGVGGGDVTSGSTITDNAIVRGDGGAKGVQGSGVYIDDSDSLTLGSPTPVSGAKLSIDGDADQIQMLVQANATQTATMLRLETSGQILLLEVDSTGNISANGGLTLGVGTTGVDIALTLEGDTNTGVITWMEDEDYFLFADDLFMNGTEKIFFGVDTDIFIHQNTAGELTVEADVMTNIGVVGDIILGDGTQRDIKPATDLKMDLGNSSTRFNEAWIHELHVQQSVANVSDPPTDAQLDSAFGTPATLGRGFIGTIDDADGNTNAWVVFTTDTSWFYLAKGTKAT